MDPNRVETKRWEKIIKTRQNLGNFANNTESLGQRRRGRAAQENENTIEIRHREIIAHSEFYIYI